MRRFGVIVGEGRGGSIPHPCQYHPLKAARYRAIIPGDPILFKVLCATCARQAMTQNEGTILGGGTR